MKKMGNQFHYQNLKNTPQWGTARHRRLFKGIFQESAKVNNIVVAERDDNVRRADKVFETDHENEDDIFEFDDDYSKHYLNEINKVHAEESEGSSEDRDSIDVESLMSISTSSRNLEEDPNERQCTVERMSSALPGVRVSGSISTKTISRKITPTPICDHMDWNDYHRLEVIHSFIDDLEYDFPSICTSGVIGKSLEGRDLKILKISNSDASNASIWMDAGIHAREWIAPAVATYIANHIARNFKTLPDFMTNKDWYFLPVVNPDGYEFSHTRERMWRKNRAWYGGQCFGVDLNRNFSFGWGGRGSSDLPNHVFYKGPEPFSEPESKAIRDIITNSGISFKVYITLHSFGQVIVFPFAYKDELCPDYIRLLEGATAMSKAIFDCNGNIYKVGISKDVMYGASGTSYDWSYGKAGIPYCYLIELRSKKHKFMLPKEEIEETGNEILNCVMALMELLDRQLLEEIEI